MGAIWPKWMLFVEKNDYYRRQKETFYGAERGATRKKIHLL